MQLKLSPKYVSFTKGKVVLNEFQVLTKQISLKPTNNITKTKNYFLNDFSEYEFFVKDKKNIFVKRKGMNFHFKITLDNFLEIFSKGSLCENRFKIYFIFGKVFLASDIDENSKNYSDWYDSDKKNFTSLISGYKYIDKRGYKVTYLEGLKPRVPYIASYDKYDKDKIKALLESGSVSSHTEEELVYYTGELDKDHENAIARLNRDIYYISEITLSDKYNFRNSNSILYSQYCEDSEGNFYEVKSSYIGVYNKIVLNSGKTVYVYQVSYDQSVRDKIKDLPVFATLDFKTSKNL